MISFRHLASLVLLSVLAKTNHAASDGLSQELQLIKSPVLEILMHLPPNFRNVNAFKRSLGIKPEKLTQELDSRQKRETDARSIVDVRTYKIAQPVTLKPATQLRRNRRNADSVDSSKNPPILEKPEAEKLIAPLINREKYSESMLPMPDAIRGPVYTTYPVKEFDVVDIDDPDDPRRRRNDSSDSGDDSQRDKRTFLEELGETGEATTPIPFWKRKKENPPFITGRGGSAQKGSSYTPAQHRSGENVRESHSLKNLDKTVQSNEISRPNQDNFYSATNRRTYSRQSDVTPSTPKSVYDTIDYSGKRNQNGRAEFGRNNDEKKETLRDGRTHEQYYNRQYQYQPSVYDRPLYHPPYPYPPEVIGRGVEFYHRTYDPSTGRIIYYANMPEHGRSYDARFVDPIHRNIYLNYRPYLYDPYYRQYVPPYDYRFPSGFGRIDYSRTGRSSQAYSYPIQEKEKYPRDPGFNRGSDKNGSDLRNKTYIIYDAEERPFSRLPESLNGIGYPSPTSGGLQVPFRYQRFPSEYFPPPPAYQFRNQFQPSSPGWGYSRRPSPGGPESRAPNSPDVQLPLTTSHRVEDLQQNKKP